MMLFISLILTVSLASLPSLVPSYFVVTFVVIKLNYLIYCIIKLVL